MVKSEKHSRREAIEDYRGKVLKQNLITGRSWSSVKLFIMQNYTDNANGNVPLTVDSLSSRCADVLLGTNKTLQSFSL